jgi:hypothetical protein
MNIFQKKNIRINIRILPTLVGVENYGLRYLVLLVPPRLGHLAPASEVV